MDMIKCPICGEMYSSSYRGCPFCEEDGDDSRKIRYAPKRRIANKQKTQSARGGLILVLVLVLALLSFYLFGDNILHRGEQAAEEPPVTREDEPSVPASNPNAGDDPFYEPTDEQTPDEQTPGGETTGPVEPVEPVEPEPPADENVDVSNARLNRDDFTLSYAGETFTLRVSGTEASPRWSIDNANVATLAGDGTVTAVANGSTTIRCKVGTRELTCIVRVTGTGKKAAAAEAPTVAETPAQTPATQTPATQTPATQTPAAQTVSGTLHVKTNVTGELPKDKERGIYDCTVSLSNPDGLRLIVYDDDGKEFTVGWTSGNTGVATISDDGKITTVGAGRTTMTGSVGGKNVECIIRVR